MCLYFDHRRRRRQLHRQLSPAAADELEVAVAVAAVDASVSYSHWILYGLDVVDVVAIDIPLMALVQDHAKLETKLAK